MWSNMQLFAYCLKCFSLTFHMPLNGYWVRYCSFYKLVMGGGVQPQVFSFFIFTMSHFDWPHHKIIYTTLVGHSPKWKFTYPKRNFRSECLWPHQYREISNLDKGYKVWWCYWEHLGGTCLKFENMLAMNWEHDENTLGTWCEHIENSSQTPWEIQNPQKSQQLPPSPHPK
jgi:hypothetical protein